MKFIDLSMPIWDGAGYGEVLPIPNTPVKFFEYATYEWNGIRRTEMKIDDESGSPFMTPWQWFPHEIGPALVPGRLFDWTLDKVPLERLILRDTVVLDVPGGDRYEITGDDIDSAVATADYHDGDDVLVRTSWATSQKAFEMGDRYVLDGPSWSYDACIRMAAIMEERHSGIVMTDTPLIMTPLYQGWGWSAGPERMIPKPKPWPSIEARERKMDLPPGTISPAPPEVGRGGYLELMAKTIAICKCLVNANLISRGRIKMMILPLLIKSGGASPCRFIAVED